MAVVAASAQDEAGIRRLLEAASLPTADLDADLLRGFLVEREAGGIVAVGALQWLDGDALLRSVAVAAERRGSGHGRRMVEALEQQAAGRGCRSLFLLTTTAERFFERLGYRRLARDQATPALRSTLEFSSLCPSTSALMSKRLEPKRLNVLFLCTGNSARSILAEALINSPGVGHGRFRGYSAGSHPKGTVHPLSLELLDRTGISTSGLRSKSWDEFAQANSPPLDFVFTVCDQAAGEACPYWPGQPVSAHWGMPDPAAVEGSDEERRKAFADTMMTLRRRIELFASLPLDKLDRLSLQNSVARIGRQ